MYADDLVIFSACSASLQQLFSVYSQYGSDVDIRSNDQKYMHLMRGQFSGNDFTYLCQMS